MFLVILIHGGQTQCNVRVKCYTNRKYQKTHWAYLYTMVFASHKYMKNQRNLNVGV